MTHLKYSSWENFIKNSPNKEEYNKRVKEIGKSFMKLAADHEKYWDFLTTKNGACLLMKNRTHQKELTVLHLFHNIGGLFLSSKEKKTAMAGFAKYPSPVKFLFENI